MAFGELYGHEKAIAILKNAMANNRIAHAYLFSGMEGIGKRTVASLFARALNCEGDPPPCNACASCRKAQHQNHPDIITITAEGQFIKIGAVKELQEQMKFRPREGRRRIFIMPERIGERRGGERLLKTLRSRRPETSSC
jgi:DNA polymerase-3 subunit delta'